MDYLGLAALITAVATALASVCGGVWLAFKYVVDQIMGAYKSQADATLEAKDHDLKAKEERISTLLAQVATGNTQLENRDSEIARLHRVIASHHTEMEAMAGTITELQETSRVQRNLLEALGGG